MIRTTPFAWIDRGVYDGAWHIQVQVVPGPHMEGQN